MFLCEALKLRAFVANFQIRSLERTPMNPHKVMVLKQTLPATLLFLTLLLSAIAPCQPNDSPAVSTSLSYDTAAVELKTYLENSKVPLNRRAIFVIELSWVGDMSRYHILPIPPPVLTNLMIEGSGSANRLEEVPGGQYRSIRSFTYRLSPVALGMAYIDGLEIRYQDQKTGEMNSLISQRVSVQVIDPLPDSSDNFPPFIYLLLLVIFFGAIAYFLIRYFRTRKAAAGAPEREISLAEQYLKILAHDVDPRGTNLREMTLEMARIFREYLARQYGIPAREASTRELVDYLVRAGVSEGEVQRVDEALRKWDLVKFAGGTIDPAEFTNLYGVVENFLSERKKEGDAHKQEPPRGQAPQGQDDV